MRLKSQIHQWVVLFAMAAFQTGCSSDLTGGGIQKGFEGLKSLTVMGPKTISINWKTNPNCISYKIYSLNSGSSDALLSVALPPVVLTAPIISSGQSYSFSVSCIRSDGMSSGQDVTLSDTTWINYDGNVTSTLETVGTNAQVKLSWNWSPANSGTLFKIYAQESVLPQDLDEWGLTYVTGSTTEYTGNVICETYNHEIKIGQNAECDPNLADGQAYNFKVVAYYPDGTHSIDLVGSGASAVIPSIFNEPKCYLTRSGMGPDASSSYLFLRCAQQDALINTGCSEFNVRAWQQVSPTQRVPVSEVMYDYGTLRIQPIVNSNDPSAHKIKGLELEYFCTSFTPKSKLVVRYDGTNNHPEPILKYGNSEYSGTPTWSLEEKPTYTGREMVVGDFNCNGIEDLAVGYPDVVPNVAPYYNTNVQAGLVKIYYDYSTTPGAPVDFDQLNAQGGVQTISFRDLPSYAKFGYSLSVGNLNKDVFKRNNIYYSCQDLIVGIPGPRWRLGTPSNFTGAAVILYGSAQKFQQPLDLASLPRNSPSCSGTIDNQICSPVLLTPDGQTHLRLDPAYCSQCSSGTQALGGLNGYTGNSYSQFGYKVSMIGDYNADLYDDVIVTDPDCEWDGQVIPGVNIPSTGGSRQTLREAGCAYIYWGGPSGLQLVNMGKFNNSSPDFVSPFAKIYAPIPQEYSHFGLSVSKGIELDANIPVPRKMYQTDDIVLASGSDFLISAPDFKYQVSSQVSGGTVPYDVKVGKPDLNDSSWEIDESASIGTGTAPCSSGKCPIDPILARGSSTYLGASSSNPSNFPASNKITVPLNLGWASQASHWFNVTGGGAPIPTSDQLKESTGIVFAYLGAHSLKTYTLKLDTGFTKFPNLLTDLTAYGGILSANLKDRSNGSRKIRWFDNAIDWIYAPKSSFYNPSARGNERCTSGGGGCTTGLFKHVSFFGGRNNFSVIVPSLKSSDDSVSRFGLHVELAGTQGQNAVALYEFSDLATGSAYEFVLDSSPTRLVSRVQGGLHSTIRGESVWEVGLPELNTKYASTSSSSLSTSSENTAQTTSVLPDIPIARSAVYEKYNFGTVVSSQPPYRPRIDGGGDGYGDVIITTGKNSANRSSVFFYHGNWSADFTYSLNDNSSDANCMITKDSIFTTLNAAFQTSMPSSSSLKPYSTFSSRARVKDGQLSDIHYQFPHYIQTVPYKYYPLRFLGDTAQQDIPIFTYPTSYDRSTDSLAVFAKARCKPTKKELVNETVTSISSNDLNKDGFIDFVYGSSDSNSSTGKSTISYASNVLSGTGVNADFSNSSTGYGSSEQPIIPTSQNLTVSSGLFGASVAGSAWKRIDETYSTNLFVGAPGINNGEGRIFHYSEAVAEIGGSSLKSVIEQDLYFPANVNAEYSKIVGNIDGEHGSEILVPVLRRGPGGSLYFDAVIYFSSEYGPVTYEFCVSKLSQITLQDGTPITEADCRGTTSPLVAKIVGLNSLFKLPQYIQRPTGVGYSWTLNAYEVGDINGDGKDDIFFLDYGTFALSELKYYMFYGSSTGLVMSTPAFGDSTNGTPQLIASNVFYLYSENFGSSLQPLSTFWYSSYGSSGLPINYGSNQRPPFASGDFNRDGFRDLAISVTTADSPGRITPWKCSNGDQFDPDSDPCFNPGSLTGPASSTGTAGSGHGLIVVFYGSDRGLQTAKSGSSPINYPSHQLNNCPDFYDFGSGTFGTATGCQYAATGAPSVYSEIYDTLYFSGQGWKVNTDRVNCNSSGQCKTQLIRSPYFFDSSSSPASKGYWYHITNMGFGTSITVADINDDGVDDLLVGAAKQYLPEINTSGYLNVLTGDTTHTVGPSSTNLTLPQVGIKHNNQTHQGVVHIYYGSEKSGLVAPHPKMMIGELGLGLDSATSGSITTARSVSSGLSNIPFSIYPSFASSGNSIPALDRDIASTNSTIDHRNFGINMVSGDFNGDLKDDLAVVSARGQLYVYYAPFCAFHNSSEALNGGGSGDAAYGTYKVPNKLTKRAMSAVSDKCRMLDLGPKFGSFNNPPVTTGHPTVTMVAPDGSDLLLPQMISPVGANSTSYFGSMLEAKRPTRDAGESYPGVKFNEGDMNGDGTSELIYGTGAVSDTNVTGNFVGTTGLGMVYFGHKEAVLPTDMKTDPGLYNSIANYTSSIVALPQTSETKYFITPVLLRPHTSNGETGLFFRRPMSLGDLDGGSRTGDLIIPTEDYHKTADGIEGINLGGFKIIH